MIYLDVLFCVNFVIDYMILLTLRSFLSLSCRIRRMLLGAAAGGLSSFVILLPPMPSGVSLVLNVGIAFLIIGITFAPLPKKSYFKAAAGFFLISFCYCGGMLAICLLFAPSAVMIRNGSVYIAVSPIWLVVTTLLCYGVLRLILRITGRGEWKNLLCTVIIRYNGETVSCKGKIDTGNHLREPFSGEPVIVADARLFHSYPNPQTPCVGGKRMRLVPFTSVGGEGLLPAVKPEKVVLCYGKNQRETNGYVAFYKGLDGGIEALVPSEMIE